MKNKIAFLVLIFSIVFFSCKKKDNTTTDNTKYLIFKFKFDSTQVRLNNLGNPSIIPSNHGAQSPQFNSISAHYFELAPNAYTALGQGKVLYHAPENTLGGDTAIDFNQAIIKSQGEEYLKIPLKDVVGTFNFIRVSLAYQNYAIKLNVNNPINGTPLTMKGTLASFVGFNTYIQQCKIKDSTITVNDDKLQGYWAFEFYPNAFIPSNYLPVLRGQTPPGATTVPNPLAASSPIPAGSCVVTGQFVSPLIIAGNETNDIIVTVSLSINKSFEWSETDGDNIYEPLGADNISNTADDEKVVDMGLRGLIPSF